MKLSTAMTRTLRTALGLTLGTVALFAATAFAPAPTGGSRQPPTLPPGCEALAAPAGNSVSFHGFAVGVQIYKFNGTTSVWDFVAPSALLFADAGGHGLLATHYAGPTWETNSGSKVVGSVAVGCTPDPSAIRWLLLNAVSSQGPGPLNLTTYIQRVNTTGGLAPSAPGAPDEIVEVPYTAEYYFYRAN